MADHFAVMAGRLLTASTVQSAIDEASNAASSSAPACGGEAVVVEGGGGRPKSGVLVECRICQEDGDETCMEAPCSCKGSLKYAHRTCVQRWCDEKGDTICEICLQQFTPNYKAPSKLFQQGRNSIFFRTPAYIQAQARSSSTSTSYEYDRQASTPKAVICCRIIAITLMLLLVLHDTISVYLGDQGVYTVALVTLLMLRTAGIVIPVYIILVAVTEVLYRRSEWQVSEPAAAGSTQPVPIPPQQQRVVITIQ
uniref:RING-CH-type domain-containing protein n=1 Tax=Aegilops tauschii subsp. strangulata TaxID=200361 RepID=A0A452ZT44_AEGTS